MALGNRVATVTQQAVQILGVGQSIPVVRYSVLCWQDVDVIPGGGEVAWSLVH